MVSLRRGVDQPRKLGKAESQSDLCRVHPNSIQGGGYQSDYSDDLLVLLFSCCGDSCSTSCHTLEWVCCHYTFESPTTEPTHPQEGTSMVTRRTFPALPIFLEALLLILNLFIPITLATLRQWYSYVFPVSWRSCTWQVHFISFPLLYSTIKYFYLEI